MNKKGLENGMIGTLVILAVAIIVCLTLLTGGISSSAASLSTLTSLSNVTYTAPASAGLSINIPYQALKGTITVTNATSGTVIPATNYTITNYVVSNGQLVTTLTANAGNSLGWQGKSINISSTSVEPFGYDTNSGSRAISGLIIIFAIIALVIAVMVPVVKNGIIDFV